MYASGRPIEKGIKSKVGRVVVLCMTSAQPSSAQAQLDREAEEVMLDIHNGLTTKFRADADMVRLGFPIDQSKEESNESAECLWERLISSSAY